MLYLLEVTIYSALLFSVYLLVLRNTTLHSWNRAYLLLCGLLPLILPLVYIPGVELQSPISTTTLSVALPEIIVSPNMSSLNSISSDTVFTAVYLLVSVILLVRLAIQYWSLKKFVKSMPYTLYPNNVNVITNCGYGPGSFGKYVFFPGEEIQQEILQHELAHIKHRHSRDIVCLKLLQCLLWPNAMLVVIMKELRLVHEFEADTKTAVNKTEYTRTLLNSIFQTRTFSLSHTFFHHPIKRRIVMLQKTPQSRNTLRRTIIRSGILAATLIAGVVYLQSCNRQENLNDDIAKPKTEHQLTEQEIIDAGEKYAKTHEVLPTANDGKVLNYAELMPEPTVDIPTFLGANIKYPEEARNRNIEGKVLVKFIIDEQGNLTSPVILRTPDQLLSDEAIRVIKMMPKWKPGKDKGKNVSVYFTIPISFKLS